MPLAAQTTWQSELVKMDNAGRIVYHKDADGFVISDFSHAGYKGGEPVPDYRPPAARIEAVMPIANADNTENIQRAIDKIAALTPDADGFRGLVQLAAGKFLVDGTIHLNASGIVLRGAGRGPDVSTDQLTNAYLQNMTLIYRRGTGAGLATNVIVMGPANAGSATWGSNTGETNRVNITTEKVMQGDFSFDVQSAADYLVGNAICIKYPSTEAFLEAIWYGGNSNWVNGGNEGSKWRTSNINICYHRYIAKIEGNRITVDAPVFYALDKKYSQAYIHKITTGTILTNIAVENLRVSMDRTPRELSRTPDQNCIKMNALENCWVKNLHLSDFIHAGVKTEAVTRSTIENCRAVECSGIITGGNQYNFDNSSRSQLILVKDCEARNGRHHWVSNGGASVSGIVVLNFTSSQANAASEGHRLFTQGVLIDGWKETGTFRDDSHRIGFFLRDNMGTNHGWGAINSVLWNCDIQNGAVYLDNIPTGQNYSIGSTAKTVRKFRGDDDKYTTGYNEGQNKPGLFPKSLYEAQLKARKSDEYELMGVLNPEAIHVGWNYAQLHNDWLRTIGFDYTEHPNCTGNGYGGHNDGVHLSVVHDPTLDKHVFRFDIHITPVIDGDRCGGNTDRQRNELKSATNNTTWAKLQGNWDEWQRLEWKFKLPVGFQPTNSFCHIHQIKAQDGRFNGSPVITITPRANSDGTNKRMQIIHSADGGARRGLGAVVDNIPLSEFEGEWVQVVEEIHYRHDGYFSIKITRIRDNKVLLSYTNDNIDMWRTGSSFLRSKFGIYRSLAGGRLNNTPVNQSPLLKNESMWMCDLKIYEKNTNPNPSQPH